MSLQSDDDGAVCLACGHFDFLPLTCVRCHGIFCGTHISDHLSPSTQQPCVDAPVAAPPLPTQTDGPCASPLARCVVCGGGWCVLAPCPQCGRDYCAAHRFHGHAAAERTRRPYDHTRAASLSPSADLAAVCAGFVASSPLSLAPAGRAVSFSALVWRVGSPPALVAVRAAGETSVGQMLERWGAAHPAFGGPSPPRLFHIALDAQDGSRLWLRDVPRAVRVDAAGVESRVVAVAVQSGDVRAEAVADALAPFLFAPTSPPRVRAAGAMVRLQSAAKRSPAALRATECCEAHTRTPSPSASPFSPPSEAGGAGGWPFRRPPPLDAFALSRSRANPHVGAGVRGGSGVLVAVFVADGALPAAVPPFCVVVGAEWSVGRVVECVARVASAETAARWQLFKMRTQENVGAGGLGKTHGLHDGDLLFLGQDFPGTLRDEVARLQALEGRAAAGLKAKTMNCALM